MATKVKGEAIKEGSIPLSALKSNRYNLSNNEDINEIKKAISEFKVGFTIIQNSYYNNIYITNVNKVGGNTYNITGINGGDTFKKTTDINNISNPLFTEDNKIDVSIPTPDWNAQEDEIGYIKNKPFGDSFKAVNWFYDDAASWCITPMMSNKVKYEGVIYEIPDNADEYVYLGDESIALKKYPYYDNNLMYVSCLGIQDESDERLQNILFKVNTKLDDKYLPNTVLKTTPQTLSDTDKNQALINLGIPDKINTNICLIYPDRFSGTKNSYIVPNFDEIFDRVYVSNLGYKIKDITKFYNLWSRLNLYTTTETSITKVTTPEPSIEYNNNSFYIDISTGVGNTGYVIVIGFATNSIIFSV